MHAHKLHSEKHLVASTVLFTMPVREVAKFHEHHAISWQLGERSEKFKHSDSIEAKHAFYYFRLASHSIPEH